MKIKELLEKLNQFDGEMEVVVSGYESGYESLDDVKEIRVLWGDKQDRCIYGEHTEANNRHLAELLPTTKVIYIGN